MRWDSTYFSESGRFIRYVESVTVRQIDQVRPLLTRLVGQEKMALPHAETTSRIRRQLQEYLGIFDPGVGDIAPIGITLKLQTDLRILY